MAAPQGMCSPTAADGAIAGSPGTVVAVVVKPHEATDDSQLALTVGKHVYVLEKDPSGWWGGHHDDDTVTGWFPGSCVREVRDPGLDLLTPAGSEQESLATARLPVGTATGADGEQTARAGGDRQAVSPWPRFTTVPSPQGRVNLDIEFSRASGGEKSYHSFKLGSPEVQEEHSRELARLRAENAELRTAKRQSVQDSERLEALAAAEREKASELEQKLQAEVMARELAASEAEVLREQLQREKRQSEAQLQQIKEEYERQLSRKAVAQALNQPDVESCAVLAPWTRSDASEKVVPETAKVSAAPLPAPAAARVQRCCAPAAVDAEAAARPAAAASVDVPAARPVAPSPPPRGGWARREEDGERPRRGVVAEHVAAFERCATPVRGARDLGELPRAGAGTSARVAAPTAASRAAAARDPPTTPNASWRHPATAATRDPVAAQQRELETSLLADDDREVVFGMSPFHRK